MTMGHYVTFRAGTKALEHIRINGFNLDDVSVLAGAAGGPKWLILSGTDRHLCTLFPRKRKRPLYLTGSSIGSWRFAAYAQENPLSAMERFLDIYLEQRYSEKPDTAEISRVTERMMDEFLTDRDIDSILSHPSMRMQFFAVRSRGIIRSDYPPFLLAGLLFAASANFFNRGLLSLFFRQTLFYDPREEVPFMQGECFEKVSLTHHNFRKALMASASIPLVMKGVSGITGAPGGVYRDGGMVDYHLDVPYSVDTGSIILYPHYTDMIIPGWFDKPYPWRRANHNNMERVLLLSPSEKMIEKLPLEKIPDRNDFLLFKGNDSERVKYWNKVADESRRMGDEVMEVLSKNQVYQQVREL